MCPPKAPTIVSNPAPAPAEAPAPAPAPSKTASRVVSAGSSVKSTKGTSTAPAASTSTGGTDLSELRVDLNIPGAGGGLAVPN